MKTFLDEIQATLDCGIWSPALASVLTVPDACGAIEFPNEGNGSRYTGWYDAFVEAFSFTELSSGSLVWKIRNSMLHEAGIQFDAFGFDRVLFTVPRRGANIYDQVISQPTREAPKTLGLDLQRFVARISRGAEGWMDKISTEPEKRAQLDRLLQLRPHGLAPHMVGMPLIA